MTVTKKERMQFCKISSTEDMFENKQIIMTAEEAKKITRSKILDYIQDKEPDLFYVLKQVEREAEKGNAEYVFDNEKHPSLQVEFVSTDVYYGIGWDAEFKNKDKVGMLEDLGYRVSHNFGMFFCSNKITISW